jgi:3-oxoacyl-[acyl-carrier-protein] synthase-3
MSVQIEQIEYYLPKNRLNNDMLTQDFPTWSAEKIESKTGIYERGISSATEFTSDLAVAAAEKIFDKGFCKKSDIDFLLLCTQTPDYLLPTTACIIQNKLGLSTHCGALDFNLGCSGYIYGLSLAQGLITSGSAKKVLFLTGDTYSKLIGQTDHANRTLFGDGASATLISASSEQLSPWVFSFGTDGNGENNLIVKNSAMHYSGGDQTLYMNGGEIFNFTLNRIPTLLSDILFKSGLSESEIDRYVFHQANGFMLEHLRRKIGVPKEKFIVNLRNTGNTVSSTIPIAIKNGLEIGSIQNDQRIMLVGFGVGYSWGATIITINLEA